MGRMLKQMSPVGQPMQAILRDAYQDWKWAEPCSDCIDFPRKSTQDYLIYEDEGQVQFLFLPDERQGCPG